MEKLERVKRCSRNLVVTVAILSVAGCATSPIVRWERPTVSAVPDYSLSYAMTYANKARDAYQQAIDRDTSASNTLSSGLIGLGAVVAALATYGAHRDTLIGAGLLGGTAYALGQWNLSRPRLLIYQAGVEGINCSVRAIMPLYISPVELEALGNAVADLETKAGNTTLAIAAVRKELGSLPTTDARRKIAEDAISEAGARVDRARALIVSARQFITAARRAGPELVAAVDRISAAVDKAVLDTIPDLSSVPKVVGSLAGLAGSFAPGVESRITSALTSSGLGAESALIGQQVMSAQLKSAIDVLLGRSDELANVMATVQGRLTGYDTSASTARLADCGVTGIDVALKANPTRIDLKPGVEASKLIVVSGGASTIYTGTFLEGPPDGLTLKAPLAGDRTFHVVATKSLTQTGPFPILITDAARKEVRIDVVVSGDVPKPPAGGSTDAKAIQQNLVNRLKDIKVIEVDQGKFTVDASKTQVTESGVIEVWLTCEGSPTMSSQALLDAFKSKYGAEPTVMAAVSRQMPITFKSDGSCIKAAGAESALIGGSSPVQVASLKSDQIKAIQRSLCLPPGDIVGKWGPKTSYAFAAWRARRGAAGTAVATSLTREEFDALARADSREAALRCPR